MSELNQSEKELIIISLGNSLSDHKQSDIHHYVADLYERLILRWSEHTDHHTAKEIIEMHGG